MTNMKKIFLTIIAMLLPLMASATYIKDINYDLDSSTETATVIKGSYSGYVNIPSQVTYNGVTYTVKSIGRWAFCGCSSLTSVTIPNSVTSIGSYAFEDCCSLTSIIIPDGVMDVSPETFSGCSSLTSITLPKSLTRIGENAFDCCIKLNAVYISDLEAYLKITFSIGDSPSNPLFYAHHLYLNGMEIKDLVIPNTITSIKEYALCGGSSLTSIAIPNSVTSIGNGAFYGCSALTSVISEIENPFELADYVFNGVPTYAQLIVPKGKKAAYLSTTGWRKFTNIVEAGEVGQVFTVNGISYKIMENNTVTVTSGKNLSGDVSIPNQVSLCGETYSVNSISSEAFRNCGQIIAITIPNSVTSIGSFAFSGCSNLVSVIIGSGVTSIGSRAFSNTNLKKTIWLTNTLPSGYSTALGAINYVSNDQFNISNKVVYKFLSSYFEVDGIRYVPVSPSDHTCDAIDCVYNESASISKIAPTVTYKGVTLTVQKIRPYICYNNKFINHLTMEVSGAISNNAFNGCSNMQTAILGSTNNDIDKNKFAGIYIGSNITSIGDWVFSECESLNKLIIADRESELTLGSNDNSSMFSSCPLESVYIGGNITYSTNGSKGYSPFYRNTVIRSVTITDKETEISQNEFYGCTNLQKVIIGDDVNTIGNRAFSSCSSLKYFAFGSQVATIGQNAFSDCTALIEISSKAITPPECGSQALDDINKWECKLYVPDGCYDAYQNAEQWKEFFFTEEGEGTIVINDEQAVLLGDANNDGEVNIYDIDAIVDFIMSGDINSINFKNADVNKDGKVNAADIVVLNKTLN